MSLRVGDIVRTKDVVGILDGAERGPGHHEYYKVIQLNPKGDVVLQSGTGAQSVWEPQQVEVTTYGCYLAELIAEAKHHLGWVSADCNKILQQYAPDNLVNLEALEFLRNKIAEKIQSALDVAYEDVAAGLFAERADDGLKLLEPLLDFTPDSVTQQIEDLKDRVKEGFLLTPAEVQFSADGRLMMASTKPEQPMVMSTPPETTDAELLNLSYTNSVPASDPWADLMGSCDRVRESNERASEALTRAQAACDKAIASIEGREEIKLSELAELTNNSLQYLTNLIRRKVLPEGRKIGRTRWVPKKECLEILEANPGPNKAWPRLDQPAALANTWDSLL